MAVPAATYLYLCRPGKHYLDCHTGSLPPSTGLLNVTAENGQIKLLLESAEWEGGTLDAPLPLDEPQWRVLREAK